MPDLGGSRPYGETYRETKEERDARVREAAARGGTPTALTDPVTPEEVAEHRAKAAAHAAASLGGGAEKSPTERHLAYWAMEEANLRAQLALDLPEAAEYRARLAEALRNLGRLTEAAALAPERADEFGHLRRAIEKADDVDCACSDYLIEVEHPTVAGRRALKAFPRYRLLGHVYSPRHEGLVFVTQCLRCGDTNARPTLPALLQQRLDAAADHPGERDGADIEVLVDASDEQRKAHEQRKV